MRPLHIYMTQAVFPKTALYSAGCPCWTIIVSSNNAWRLRLLAGQPRPVTGCRNTTGMSFCLAR